MKAVITITKQEIEEAIKSYFADRMEASYNHKLSEPKLNFTNKDSEIGYFECAIEVDVTDKDTKA